MTHYSEVCTALSFGQLVPFLGAGVNLFGRNEQEQYTPRTHLPSGRELSEYLATLFTYPLADRKNLLRVSQYASVMLGSGSLYSSLGEIFDFSYPVTPLHQFFARLPQLLTEKGYQYPYQLIVTTNYDDVLERAFQDTGEPYDLVSYIANERSQNHGRFRHIPEGTNQDDAIIIAEPNNYKGLPIKGRHLLRTIILKIHGAVDRLADRENVQPDETADSFVITEDDYINYLAHTDVSRLLPAQLVAKIRTSNLLFLGYGLRDWNLRVILNRIWEERALDYPGWAIQLQPEELDRRFWSKRGVTLIDERLETYIEKLLQNL